ncbi:MAG: transglutaminase domain-containing protein [Monoglobales bacterium]
MKVQKKWIGIAIATGLSAVLPMTVLAGWEQSGTSYRYQKENGSYAASEWVLDNGIYYYMDQNGIMAKNTTTPDGYLVGTDGSWIQEKQVTGGYVRTPYDNQPYRIHPDLQTYIFDERTDDIWGDDSKVLAAVRGIYPAEDLNVENRMVYEIICDFLVDFPYGSSDYEKAKLVYEYLQNRAVYEKTKNGGWAYGILVEGKGQCVGFSSAYMLLAKAVGLSCGTTYNYGHMWNVVFIDGTPKDIDASTIGTSAEFYLNKVDFICPYCGTRNRFGNRVKEQPCISCGNLLQNPSME